MSVNTSTSTARAELEGTAWAGVLLEVHGLVVSLGRNQVINGVDLTVEPGRWLAVVGTNGAGKSTLLKALAGLNRHQGSVLLDGSDVTSLSARERTLLIGYAPQSAALTDGTRVRDYVLHGRTPQHTFLTGVRELDRVIVEQTLARLDLAGVADRSLGTLSGGERQRAVLARALAQQPRLLLLDEPTGALDLGHAQQMLELVDTLRREDGVTVVSTLHDLVLAGQYADRIALLDGGRIAASGRPVSVLTAQMLAEFYGARAEVEVGPDGIRVHPVRPPRR